MALARATSPAMASSAFIGVSPGSQASNPFSPPAGSVIVVTAYGKNSYAPAGWGAPSITDSLATHLTWTLALSQTDTTYQSGVWVWWAVCPSAQSNMTVTPTLVANGGQYVFAMDVSVSVYTGANTSAPIGATAKGAFAGQTLSQPLTPTASGSALVIAGADGAGTGTVTAGASCFLLDAAGSTATLSTAADAWAGTSATAFTASTSGSAQTLSLVGSSSAQWEWVAYEVLAASGGGGGGTTVTKTQTARAHIQAPVVLTPLTLYTTETATSTLATAYGLTTAASGTATAKTSKIARSTGWGELYSQGNTSNWAAAGSEPSPSGNGFLLDDTSLEGATFPAGTWAPTLEYKASTAHTGVLHFRAYKYNSTAGTYSLIVDCASASTAFGTTATTISAWASGTSGPQVTFGSGDKLYVDVVEDITSASSSNTATMGVYSLGTATSLVTPCYSPATSPVGSLADTVYTSGGTTLAVTPQAVGDVLVVCVDSHATFGLTSLSGGGVATWNKAVQFVSARGHDIEIWYGTVTTAGASTITATWPSPGVSGFWTEYTAQEFSSTLGSAAIWSVDNGQAQSVDGPSSTSVPYPTLTPAAVGDLYYGYAGVPNTPSLGTTPGFTYQETAGQNVIAYSDTVTGTVSPTCSQSPAGLSENVGVLLAASTTAPPVSRSATQTAHARVQKAGSYTQPVHARISVARTTPQTAHARISKAGSAAQPAHARISKPASLTQPARARVQKSGAFTQQAHAWLQEARTATQTAHAHIQTLSGRSATQTAHGRIQVPGTAAQTVHAYIAVPASATKTQTARARLQAVRSLTQRARARLTVPGGATASQTAHARIQNTGALRQTARARIARAGTLTQAAHAVIVEVRTATQAARARIEAALALTQSARARIRGIGVPSDDVHWGAGEPFGGWSAGKPFIGWTAEEPHGDWSADEPY